MSQASPPADRLDRIEALLANLTERQTQFQNQLEQSTSAWKSGIEDSIRLMTRGIEDLGSRLEEKQAKTQTQLDQTGSYVGIVAELVAALGREASVREARTDELFRETREQLQGLIDMAKQNIKEHNDWRDRFDRQGNGEREG